MNSLRRLLTHVADLSRPWLGSAEDPRESFAGIVERHEELLGQIRAARGSIVEARERLESKLAAGRRTLDELAARPGSPNGAESGRFAEELRQRAERELRGLESELRVLRQEEEILPLAEQRITAEVETLRARRDVLAARSQTEDARQRVRQALANVSAEMASLGAAVQEAERRTEHLQARAAAIQQLVDLGLPAEGPGDGAARRLAIRFAFEIDRAAGSSLESPLREGLEAAELLAVAYERLRDALAEQAGARPPSLVRVPALADELYRQGVKVLQHALALTLAVDAESTDGENGAASPQAPAGVHDLVQHARRCRDALQQTRIDLAALDASSSVAEMDAVADTLISTMQQARQLEAALTNVGGVAP